MIDAAVHLRGPFPWAADVPYSQLVQANGFAFLSGQYGAADDGEVVSGFREQTEQTFRNIQLVLQAVGADLSSVVHLRVFLTAEADLAAFREVRSVFFGAAPFPAMTVVFVAALVAPEMQIEIEATAAVPTPNQLS